MDGGKEEDAFFPRGERISREKKPSTSFQPRALPRARRLPTPRGFSKPQLCDRNIETLSKRLCLAHPRWMKEEGACLSDAPHAIQASVMPGIFRTANVRFANVDRSPFNRYTSLSGIRKGIRCSCSPSARSSRCQAALRGNRRGISQLRIRIDRISNAGVRSDPAALPLRRILGK